jgi:hypothetical protein
MTIAHCQNSFLKTNCVLTMTVSIISYNDWLTYIWWFNFTENVHEIFMVYYFFVWKNSETNIISILIKSVPIFFCFQYFYFIFNDTQFSKGFGLYWLSGFKNINKPYYIIHQICNEKKKLKLEAQWAEPVLLTFHSALKKLNAEPSIAASHQISVHFGKAVSEKKIFRNRPI